MRAAVYTKYGPPEVVTSQEVPRPAPGPRDLLVRVGATTVTSGDARLRAFNLPRHYRIPGRLAIGVFGPRKKILGAEFAGTVEAVGRKVTRFAPGDRVFGIDVFGCHADYKLVREDKCVTLIPEGVDLEAAVSVPFGGVTAFHFLDRGGLRAGQRVLINGASGAVGAYAVQLAHLAGAEVTAVCSSANAALVRGLGADHVIDYATTDFAQSDGRYNLIMDTIGNAPFRRCASVLAPCGALLAVLDSAEDLFRRPKDGRRIIAGTSAERPDHLQRLAELLAAGRLRPVIDRVYRFSDIAAAHARVDTGHKRGAVIVRL